MAKEEVIKEIIDACCEIGADIPLMLAICESESTFGTDPETFKEDGTVGYYQIAPIYIEDYNKNDGRINIHYDKRIKSRYS